MVYGVHFIVYSVYMSVGKWIGRMAWAEGYVGEFVKRRGTWFR
jgi:hypothetical protein